RSKYRIRRELERLPGVIPRRVLDPPGDTGCFLIVSFAGAKEAREVNAALRAEGIVTSPGGISNILMTNWGLHLYSNNASLVDLASTDGRGFPWTLADNRGSALRYAKGTCPVADSLFERSILLAIPSCLTTADEDDIVSAFQKVVPAGVR
ncbi:MAG: hypothetical protein KJZ78_22755, partial [Bryobacteraceae bacterium]|nr:hypothetical protein [Bryobacteraceae bacterium]